jgi:tetratricopeptide (TPR) repeat protein
LIGNLVDGGSICVEQDEARAEQLLFDILRIDANIPEVHTYMGMLRRFQGRLDDSKAELEIAVGLVRNNILATSQLGLTLIHLGQPDAALPLLEWCLRLAPHDPTTPAHSCHLGLCHLLLSRVDEATTCFRNARAINPQLFHVHYLLAAALALRGDLDEARQALRRAVEIRPDAGSRSALNELLRQSSPSFLKLYRRTVYAGVLLAGISVVAPTFVLLPD